jgi:hypothetical protein
VKLPVRIQSAIANARFRRELERLRFPRQAVGFDEAKKIGILYDATRESDYESVKQYIKTVRKEGKEVFALGFVDRKELPPSQFAQYGLDFFTRRNIGWDMIPANLMVNNFIQEAYDIVINLADNTCFPLRYIAAVSHARFRVGRFDKRTTGCYDLMLNIREDTGIAELLAQVENTLRLIKSKHAEQKT